MILVLTLTSALLGVCGGFLLGLLLTRRHPDGPPEGSVHAVETLALVVNQSLNLQEVLETAVETVIPVMSVDAAWIRLREGHSTNLVLAASQGLSAEYVQDSQRIPEESSFSGAVAASGAPLVVTDIRGHPTRVRPALIQENIRSVAIAPMITRGQTTGVLIVATRHRRSFSPGDLQLLTTVAGQIAIAVENARLYQMIKNYSTILEERVHARTADLEAANRDLRRASQAKSEFLSTMSHELRTPLNAVIGFSEVLEDETFGPLNPKQTRYVQNIHSSGRHLLRLITDILDLSKVEAGKMEIRPEEVGLRGAIEEVVAALKPAAESKRITLTSDLTPEDLTVAADPARLTQILTNLLSNAVKFTPSGGTVRLSVHRAARNGTLGGNLVEIVVADTGIGIREEDFERIFAAFQQVDGSDARRYEGTGLGLALTKKLVELHGGQLTVASTVGVGSIFTVSLPPSPLPSDRPPPGAPLPEGTAVRDDTGLFSREYFLRRLSEGGTSPCSLLILDFTKSASPVEGAIRAAAEYCRRHLRGEDTAARFDPGRVAILLPGTPRKAAHGVARRIVAHLTSEGYAPGEATVASVPEDAPHGIALLARAEAAVAHEEKS